MNASDLELPPHLYNHTTGSTGSDLPRVTLDADKLIAWSERGRGDAVERWCKQFCDRELDAIDTWEDNRVLQLEEEWMSIEKDVEEEEEDEDENRYHQACDLVAREADARRARAHARKVEQQAAIERRVQEARAYIAAHKSESPPEEAPWFDYLLALAGIAAVAFVLMT